MGYHFSWNGLVLANSIAADMNDDCEVHGELVVGLDGTGSGFRIRNGGTVRFNSCYVVDAGRELAHLEPLAGTWWGGDPTTAVGHSPGCESRRPLAAHSYRGGILSPIAPPRRRPGWRS